MLEAIRILYKAERWTQPEYIYNVFAFLEDVHEARIMAGDYDAEIKPITKKMNVIRKAYALSETQDVLNGERRK